MSPDISFDVQVTDGVGTLRWEATAGADALEHALSLAADEAILAHNLRRLQVELLADDTIGRRALHRAGFRREGRLRAAFEREPGTYVDVLVYARLAVDQVYGPGGFSGVMDSVLPTKRLIGHAVARNASGQVLLLQTSYKDDWELPGGVIEPGEPPRAGATREIQEELGLTVELGPPVLIDWMPPSLGWSDAVEYLYDLGTLDDEQIAAMHADAEIDAYHWVDPDRVAAHVTPLSARRIALVLQGGTHHTEDGYEV